MSYRTRIYRQRNTRQSENDKSAEQDKFFNRSSGKGGQNGTKNAFFQAKSNDAPGGEDALEKEAGKNEQASAEKDPAAAKDPASTDKDPAAEQKDAGAKDPAEDKKEEKIQRLATPEEDKKTATNDERQKNDKDKQS